MLEIGGRQASLTTSIPKKNDSAASFIKIAIFDMRGNLMVADHKLRVAAESGRLRDPAVANRRLGRLLQRYQRAAAAFEVKIAVLPPVEAEPGKRKKKPPGLAITWTRADSWHAWAAL